MPQPKLDTTQPPPPLVQRSKREQKRVGAAAAAHHSKGGGEGGEGGDSGKSIRNVVACPPTPCRLDSSKMVYSFQLNLHEKKNLLLSLEMYHGSSLALFFPGSFTAGGGTSTTTHTHTSHDKAYSKTNVKSFFEAENVPVFSNQMNQQRMDECPPCAILHTLFSVFCFRLQIFVSTISTKAKTKHKNSISQCCVRRQTRTHTECIQHDGLSNTTPAPIKNLIST